MFFWIDFNGLICIAGLNAIEQAPYIASLFDCQIRTSFFLSLVRLGEVELLVVSALWMKQEDDDHSAN